MNYPEAVALGVFIAFVSFLALSISNGLGFDAAAKECRAYGEVRGFEAAPPPDRRY